jgi:hypothetical protein
MDLDTGPMRRSTVPGTGRLVVPGALGKNSLLTNEQSVAKTIFPTSLFCATIKAVPYCTQVRSNEHEHEAPVRARSHARCRKER